MGGFLLNPYVLGAATPAAIPFNLPDSEYNSVNITDAAQGAGNIADIAFSNDGTRLFVISDEANQADQIHQYSLTTAWDIDTATFTKSSASLPSSDTPLGLCFNDDGTRVYFTDNLTKIVVQITLPTPFDVGSLGASVTANLGAQITNAFRGGQWNADGTKFFALDSGTGIYQYTASTPYTVSTLSYDSVNLDTSNEDTNTQGFYFSKGGEYIYTVGSNTDSVYRYSLPTPYVLTGGSFDTGQVFDISSEVSIPTGIVMKASGDRYYVSNAPNTIYQYDINTGAAWKLQNAAYNGVTATALNLLGLSNRNPTDFIFGDSGNKAYLLSDTADAVYELDASTPYSLAALTYNSVFQSVAEDANPHGIFFKPDGTKMFMVGLANDAVYAYSMSTAWDLSTLTYDSVSFSVATETTTPTSIFFKPDGTKMFVVGLSNGEIQEYNLSTPWLISTATAGNAFDISNEEAGARGLWFKDDGTRAFITGGSSRDVHQYELSTAWDITSAKYIGEFFELVVPYDPVVNSCVTFNADGTRFWVSDDSTDDDIFEFNIT